MRSQIDQEKGQRIESWGVSTIHHYEDEEALLMETNTGSHEEGSPVSYRILEDNLLVLQERE